MALLNFHPPVIAHRGASAYAPENTMAAFTKAAQLGIKWIEFDVMQASCGEPVIFHDDLLERTTNGKGEVDEHAYAFLRSLDAGKWFDSAFSGERIPSLGAVIEFLRHTKLSANVEIKAKPGHEEKLIVRVLEDLSEFMATDTSTILFSSFSLDALHLLRKHSPTCLLGLLLHEWLPDWKALCLSLQCVSVHVNHEILTRDDALAIKQMDKALLCYTVNEVKRARELYSWGVDAIFTDVPDKMVKALAL